MKKLKIILSLFEKLKSHQSIKTLIVALLFSLLTVPAVVANPDVRILVVEDTTVYFMDIVGYLIKQNYTVEGALTAKQAIETWETFKPDIVLLDMNFTLDGEIESREAGLEVLKQAPKDKAKVILMSNGYSPPIVDDLVDKDLGGKFKPDNKLHVRELKSLIDGDQGIKLDSPSKRIHTLAKLEEAKAKGITIIGEYERLSDINLKLEKLEEAKAEEARRANSLFGRCRTFFIGR